MHGVRAKVLGAAEPDREAAADVRQGNVVIVHPISHRGAARFHGKFALIGLGHVLFGVAMLWFHVESSRRHWKAWQAGER